ncbi:MAG TPA: M81 family metallopeptidase [Candidatus Hydrogenedentes bacterium]|nr:M81 family metallopeptidase [Candidatus Hydrogenedentota bacterium]HIJ72932.1 M81 family metallopeptidase [Candidatus Hydrogenedentota bacterium]
MARLRIAVGQISLESNSFIATVSGIDHFRSTGYLWQGNEVFSLRGTESEVAGMLSILEEEDVEVVPLVTTRGNSTGLIASNCYCELKARMLALLEAGQPVDGVLLSCHGSMVIEDLDDPEGDLAAAIRALVGPQTPLVTTLDIHGNVTKRMVEETDAILGYREYPHDDTFEVGQRAARLMLKIIREHAAPRIGYVSLPMLLTAFNATTKDDGPFAQLVEQTGRLENDPEILTASIFFVGSYIDIEEIGCSVVVVTDGNQEKADQKAHEIAGKYWSLREVFHVEPLSVAEAVKRGRAIEGQPILLLDTADTTGGGGAGDGIGLVRELVNLQVTEICYATVVDPAGARRCMEAGVGSRLTIEVGYAQDPRWGEPLMLDGEVVKLSDGRFRYDGGILGGQTVSMGPTAVFRHDPIDLVIMSVPTYDWGEEQLRTAGLNPRDAKFIGVKNMMNFRFAYRDVMRGYFLVDISGPTPCDMRMLDFKRIPRPLYPFDEQLANPLPRS